eukprot:3346542-Prymnesium_polylepis.1
MSTFADRATLDSALRSAIAGSPEVIEVTATRVPVLACSPEVMASQQLARQLASDEARRPYIRATKPTRNTKIGSPQFNVFMGVKKDPKDGRAMWLVRRGDHELDVRFLLTCQKSAVRLFNLHARSVPQARQQRQRHR